MSLPLSVDGSPTRSSPGSLAQAVLPTALLSKSNATMAEVSLRLYDGTLLQVGDQLWVGQRTGDMLADIGCRSEVVGRVIGICFLFLSSRCTVVLPCPSPSEPPSPTPSECAFRIPQPSMNQRLQGLWDGVLSPGTTRRRRISSSTRADYACGITCRPSLPEPAVPDHERWG
jgi:hypothetical protein